MNSRFTLSSIPRFLEPFLMVQKYSPLKSPIRLDVGIKLDRLFHAPKSRTLILSNDLLFVYEMLVFLKLMQYLVNTSNRELRRLFKTGLAYNERQIQAELRKLDIKLARPNGDRRIRGSRRLVAFAKNGTRLAVFQADLPEDRGPVLPVPVGFI